MRLRQKSVSLDRSELFFWLLRFYLIVQVCSESQLTSISVVSKLLSLARYGLLAAFLVYALFQNTVKGTSGAFLVGGSAFLLILLNAFCCGGGQTLLYLFFILLSARGESMERIFRECTLVLLLTYMGIILLSLASVLPDLVDIRYLGNQTGSFFQGNYERHALGFLTSNQVPTTFLLLVFLWISIRRSALTLAETILLAALNYVAFRYCGSRIAFFLVIVTLLLYWGIRLAQRLKWERFLRGCMKLSYAAFPACCVLSLLLIYAYDSGSSFFTRLDLILNNRLSLGRATLNVCPVSLLGSGKYAGTYTSYAEATVDNGYLLTVIQYGILLGVIIIGLYVLMVHQARMRKDPYLVMILVMLAVENIINAHILSYKLVPFYCILVCAPSPLPVPAARFLRCRLRRQRLRLRW